MNRFETEEVIDKEPVLLVGNPGEVAWATILLCEYTRHHDVEQAMRSADAVGEAYNRHFHPDVEYIEVDDD
jgi:hypothetical protein